MSNPFHRLPADPAVIAEALRRVREGEGVGAVARSLGLHRDTIYKYLKRRGTPKSEKAPMGEGLPPIVAELLGEREPKQKEAEVCNEPPTDRLIADEEQGDTRTQEFITGQRVRTLEDAIAFAEVDTAVWRVKKWSCTSWEVGMKLTTRDAKGRVLAEQPHREQLWRVKIELERILPRAWHDATEALIKRMEERAPAYPPLPPRKRPAEPYLLEMALFDHHFGKLAWAQETGQNYDLHIAEALYRNAVLDMLDRAAGYEIAEILLPIGNDFFHIDGINNTTTAGTPQDVDGRYPKIIEVGTASMIWAVETAVQVAPIRLVRVPGNHDRITSLHLARELKAHFRHCKDVEVDISPKDRKYVRFGANLIGFTHGSEEKANELPGLMATEEPEGPRAEYREFHVGHLHKKKELVLIPCDTHKGLVVRWIPSLCGTDSWHYRKAFVGGHRAAECFLWSEKPGPPMCFPIPAREGAA